MQWGVQVIAVQCAVQVFTAAQCGVVCSVVRCSAQCRWLLECGAVQVFIAAQCGVVCSVVRCSAQCSVQCSVVQCRCLLQRSVVCSVVRCSVQCAVCSVARCGAVW